MYNFPYDQCSILPVIKAMESVRFLFVNGCYRIGGFHCQLTCNTSMSKRGIDFVYLFLDWTFKERTICHLLWEPIKTKWNPLAFSHLSTGFPHVNIFVYRNKNQQTYKLLIRTCKDRSVFIITLQSHLWNLSTING